MRIKTLCSSLYIQKVVINQESLRNFLSHEENTLSTFKEFCNLIKRNINADPSVMFRKSNSICGLN